MSLPSPVLAEPLRPAEPAQAGALHRLAAALGRPAIFFPVLALIAAAAVDDQSTRPLSPDTAWFLYAAGRVLDGARLYVDVIDVNPPFIVGFSLVPVALAQSGLLDLPAAFRLVVFATAALSLLLTSRTLHYALLPDDRALHHAALLLLAFTLLPLAGADFGQREHLATLLLAPYVASRGARAHRIAMPGALMVACGVLAGLGIGLKPPLGLGWVFAEVYLAVRLRRGASAVSPENTAVAMVLSAYVVGVVTWLPEYLELVRLIGPIYADFLPRPFLLALTRYGAAPVIVLTLVLAMALCVGAGRNLALGALVSVTAGLLLAAAVQRKGFGYHYYPALVGAIAVCGAVAADNFAVVRRALWRRHLGTIAAAILIFAGCGSGREIVGRASGLEGHRSHWETRLEQLRTAIGTRQGSLLVLSPDIGSAFPLATHTGLEWTSRFPSLWFCVALYERQRTRARPPAYRPIAQSSPIERWFVQSLVDDMIATPPDLLIVLRQRPSYLEFFSRDSRFEAVMANYRVVDDVGPYRLYERSVADPGDNGPR